MFKKASWPYQSFKSDGWVLVVYIGIGVIAGYWLYMLVLCILVLEPWLGIGCIYWYCVYWLCLLVLESLLGIGCIYCSVSLHSTKNAHWR